MKTTLILILAALSFSSYADQKNYPLQNPVVSLENQILVVEGVAARKTVSSEVGLVQVTGTVAGKVCGAYACSGKLSIGTRNEVIVSARIDSDSDGVIDGQEKKVVGILHGNMVQFDVSVVFTYVEQRYSFLERALGQKNSEYITLSIQL
jgi:hypothetical protein